MAFNDLELATEGGLPVVLYEFSLGLTTFYHTSANRDYVLGFNTYTTVPGLDYVGGSQTGDAQDDVTVTLPHNQAVARELLKFIGTREMDIAIFAIHETDVDQEKLLLWAGAVVAPRIRFPSVAFICKSFDHEINRPVLTPTYGPDCQWSQYDENCRLIVSDWELSGTVSAINGLTITTDAIAGQPAEHVRGGRFTTAENLSAWIVSQDATTVLLDRRLPDLAVGQTVTVTPSCRGAFNRCDTVFDNRAQFLGAPHANSLNPFVGEGIDGDK
ncbi:DUF2163 domain-containing protein [Exilibacterium tricleocarpae]|uniref:DUF2163 domain-containing protein n=1 Tax=Exilibacterium tricleocarpae TaxID=2591008 RepID=A0A545U6T8_9GAMM|nr:phage BR0599 family protein [Exilibacterium tricleocarpae]TQV85186.1 DUF2163 domain-containing protein [Exilibacterium tricleocarpae]